MKRLVSICTKNIEQHTVELRRNQAEYAAIHGYKYHCDSDLHWPELPASFSKVWTIRQALMDGAEIVLWADIDVGFIDMRRDLTALLEPGYWLAAYHQKNLAEWKYLCAGLMVIRNGPQAKAFIDWMVQKVESLENIDHPWENWYFDQFNRETNYNGVRCCDAKEIGCFAHHLWNDGILWDRDCPTVHLAGPGTWEQRRSVFVTKYLPLVQKGRRI